MNYVNVSSDYNLRQGNARLPMINQIEIIIGNETILHKNVFKFDFCDYNDLMFW